MTTESSTPIGPEDDLGTALAEMRKGKKITGAQLAKMVGMSQPKISRLENGVGLPDPGDVGRIARALGADDDKVRYMVELAERAHNRMTDWRPMSATLAMMQQEIHQLELGAKKFRVFQSTLVVGLLQTSGYARAVLSSFRSLGRPATPEPEYDIAIHEAVTARLRRQAVLGDRERTFHFIMTESALGNRICPPEEMVAQLWRIREVAGQANVTVGIIPADVTWIVPPMHAFDVFDEDIVIVDLLNTELTTRGKLDVRTYGQIFDIFRAQATTEIEPIIDRYIAHYLDEARPPGGEQRI